MAHPKLKLASTNSEPELPDGEDQEMSCDERVAFAINAAVKVFEASDAATMGHGDVLDLARQFEQMFYE